MSWYAEYDRMASERQQANAAPAERIDQSPDRGVVHVLSVEDGAALLAANERIIEHRRLAPRDVQERHRRECESTTCSWPIACSWERLRDRGLDD